MSNQDTHILYKKYFSHPIETYLYVEVFTCTTLVKAINHKKMRFSRLADISSTSKLRKLLFRVSLFFSFSLLY